MNTLSLCAHHDFCQCAETFQQLRGVSAVANLDFPPLNFYDPTFPALPPETSSRSAQSTAMEPCSVSVAREDSCEDIATKTKTPCACSLKNRVGTDSQRSASASRRTRAALYSCPRDGCGASFTSRHNLRCKLAHLFTSSRLSCEVHSPREGTHQPTRPWL
jgi:hypothetical protein